MGRNLFRPRSQKFSEREIYRDQNGENGGFSRGMYFDPPHSNIPDNSVAYLQNAITHPDHIEGRRGSELYSSTPYPAIEGRTGYDIDMVGGIATSNEGNIFTEADVSNYLVSPTGQHFEIQEYVSATEVHCYPALSEEGDTWYIRGRRNAELWHTTQKIPVFQFGRDLYISNLALTSYTKIPCISYDRPFNCDSRLDEMDDDAVLINSHGVYRIILGIAVPYYYRMNTRILHTKPNAQEKTESRIYGRRYLIAPSRLKGQANLRSRETEIIEQEAGTTKANPDTKDYVEIWTEKPIGDGQSTYGVWTGGVVANASLDAVGLWAPVTNGTLDVTINDTEETVWVDYAGVQTMEDVAERKQTALRQYWPEATCVFDGRFIISTAKENGSTILIEAGTGGTDITGIGFSNLINGEADNTETWEAPHLLTNVRVPTISSVSDDAQWHWTHHSIYASLDVGENGTDPVTGTGNNPEQYIWVKDLRVAAAFFARKVGGIIELRYGVFEAADTGSVIEWENGDRDTIQEIIDATHARASQAAYDYYYEGNLPWMAAAIGNGRVIRADQSGTRVEVESEYNDDVFSSADIGKTIFWSTGGYSFITAVAADGLSCTVADSTDRYDEQGITLDFTHRNFYDTTNDDKLRFRRAGWLLKQRFYEPLPVGNMGCVTPGFLFVAAKGQSVLNYSQMPVGGKYLAGYHNPAYQYDDSAKDSIQYVDDYTNRVVVFCQNSWYAGPTNMSSEVSVEEVGETVVVFNGLEIGGNIGLNDYGSYVKIDQDTAMMITSEPAVREFNGYEFGPNLAEDERRGMDLVMRDIESWKRATAALYNRKRGYIVWGMKK